MLLLCACYHQSCTCITYDKFCVYGRDGGIGVDNPDDLQLLSQPHLTADNPCQVLNGQQLLRTRHALPEKQAMLEWNVMDGKFQSNNA